ncbi:unnamed protein product [Ectocarpus sp. 8 AP-2014]
MSGSVISRRKRACGRWLGLRIKHKVTITICFDLSIISLYTYPYYGRALPLSIIYTLFRSCFGVRGNVKYRLQVIANRYILRDSPAGGGGVLSCFACLSG